MRSWEAHQIARAAGARLLRGTAALGPDAAIIDSRAAGPGKLFVGLAGEHLDGGAFAAEALSAGAWGVLVADAHARDAMSTTGGAILATSDPLAAMQRLAAAWRRDLGARVIGITGSTGKTSTKDLLKALLSAWRSAVASRANFNTEIGLPLEILAAPAGTEVLVLEMAMRGPGQIADLARIAAPDIGVIVNIGPVHLELLGSLEAIAAAKAELIAALAPGAVAIVPSDEPLLGPHLRGDLRTVTFGPAGTVRFLAQSDTHVEIDAAGTRIELNVGFTERHLRHDLLAAVAAATAVGVVPAGSLELALSPGRGQRRRLPGGVTLIDGAYNANPMSVRASLEALASEPTRGRRVAVLGDMLELGPQAERFHAAIGELADSVADVLVTVGPLAEAMGVEFHGEHHHAADAADAASLVPELLRDGDVVLVKGSHSIGLGLVCETLDAAARR